MQPNHFCYASAAISGAQLCDVGRLRCVRLELLSCTATPRTARAARVMLEDALLHMPVSKFNLLSVWALFNQNKHRVFKFTKFPFVAIGQYIGNVKGNLTGLGEGRLGVT